MPTQNAERARRRVTLDCDTDLLSAIHAYRHDHRIPTLTETYTRLWRLALGHEGERENVYVKKERAGEP